jgi:hypothetical protein
MKNHYFAEITFIKEIDLSDETIKEYFEFPDDYEVTEEDRKMYFEECIGFDKNANNDVIDWKYYISNP